MADAQLQQRAALRTVVRLHERPPPIRRVLARDAAGSVGLDLQTFRRNRLAANLADDDLLPLAAVAFLGVEPHGEIGLMAAVAR